jgi:hypothetical protein
MYPYVVPFTGSKMARDPELAPYVTTKMQTIGGTGVSWPQPEHIMPIDLETRRRMQDIVAIYEASLADLTASFPHVPSRVRSMLWVACAIPALREAGVDVPDAAPVLRKMRELLPMAQRMKARHTTSTGTVQPACAAL